MSSQRATASRLFSPGRVAYKHAIPGEALPFEVDRAPAGIGHRPIEDRMSDKRIQADVAFIEALAEMLDRNGLSEIKVRRDYGENDSLDVRVSKHVVVAAAPAPAPAAPLAPAHPVPSAPAQPAADPADPATHPGCVPSPMVGTAYLAAEPGGTPFVSVGSTVSEGQTLLIVEAMKTMNHIPAPRSGTVRRILVADGTPVEYGAPLMIVD